MVEFQTGDALLVIDVQVDFCPGGALPIPEGDAVVPVINRWVEQAARAGIPIFMSRDWHPKQHVSFKQQGGLWPTHCLQDSRGAEFHPDLKVPDDVVVITKGVRMDQDQNSAFDETGLAAYLKKNAVRRLIVGGLALDVCVRATVLDALEAGFDVLIIPDGSRPVTPEQSTQVLKDFQAAGAQVDLPEGDAGPAEEPTPMCTKAPEWAEHQRFEDDDMACDDGRSGRLE